MNLDGNAVLQLGASVQVAGRCAPSGTGQVIIDVNGYCFEGQWSFEAEKRGASAPPGPT